MKSFSLIAILFFFIAGKLNAQTSKQKQTVKQNNTVAERVINIDFGKAAGKLNTMFNECIGAGRANEGLRADWQQQLAYVRKECGFRYIRMHGLLTDDMDVYKEDSKGKVILKQTNKKQ